MSRNHVSARRRFFWKAGAALSAPLAVASACASDPGDEDTAALKARLAKLEDENAIRELNRAFAEHVNAGALGEAARLFADPSAARLDETVRSLALDQLGQGELIEIGAGRATARIGCTVRVETPIEPSCPLVEMARQQGDGVVRRTESRVLENAYVKSGGVWKIERSAYRPA